MLETANACSGGFLVMKTFAPTVRTEQRALTVKTTPIASFVRIKRVLTIAPICPRLVLLRSPTRVNVRSVYRVLIANREPEIFRATGVPKSVAVSLLKILCRRDAAPISHMHAPRVRQRPIARFALSNLAVAGVAESVRKMFSVPEAKEWQIVTNSAEHSPIVSLAFSPKDARGVQTRMSARELISYR